MKTKIFGGIAILAIALAVAFNVSLNTSKTNNASLLALANVEALASEGVSDCDIKKYNRNEKEDWKDSEWKGKVGADGYVTIKSVKFGPFGASTTISFTYKSGTCTSSPGNCCLKTQVDKVKAL